MIYYLVTEPQTKPMRSFLEGWGRSLADRVKIVPYESLLAGREPLPEQGGTYIFTNLTSINHRMSPQARSTICDLHDRLVSINGAGKVLNDPARSLQRFALLKHLYQSGKSTFNAYRATEPGLAPRFPVFIRHEIRSIFDQPAIASNPDQYSALLHGIRWLGGLLKEQIVIEFCNTADSTGLYRKYGAFVVGDRIVPRHIFFSRNWHVRVADIVDPATTEEELRYLDGNPHADALLDCCRQAGISYGRIDYGMLDGRPQIWEINTNASVASTPQAVSPERRQVLLNFVDGFGDALAAVDART